MTRNHCNEKSPDAGDNDPRESWRLQSDKGPFSRAYQLAVLRYARLPKTVKIYKSATVSGAAMKAVLHVIDDHAGKLRGWEISVQAIADEAGFERGHVTRVLRALRDKQLLSVIPRRRGTGKVASRYEICWLNLEELVPADRRLRLPQPHQKTDDATGTIDDTWRAYR